MLEYMLVRAVDAPILDQSQGLLEWVVLDEAHTDMGSQAAELALLIRRVLHAFGVRPEEVRFVATSATIGDPKGEAGRHLRRFLSDVAGVEEDRVQLVAGARLVPDLGPEPRPSPTAPDLDELEALDPEIAAEAPAPERFTALTAHPLARAIRRLFIHNEARHREQGGSGMVATLAQICRLIHGETTAYTLEQQDQALRWLDLLSGTQSPDGTPFLRAVERNGCLLPPRGRSAIDEFELDSEPVDGGSGDAEETEAEGGDAETRVLVVNRPDLPNTGTEVVDRATRRFDPTGPEASLLTLTLQHEGDHGLTCPCCGGEERGRKLMQEARIGAPFALGTILPTLLEFAPDERCKPAELPYRGRRLLTFNDSRQGTARMAARLQQESERNRIRGLVYHLVLREGRAQTSSAAERLAKEIREDEELLSSIEKPAGRRVIERRIQQKREHLADVSRPTPVPFIDLAQHLSAQGQDFVWMLDHYRRDVSWDSFGGPDGPLALARMFLVREFGRRPKRLNNLETMGLVAVCYPGLEQVQTAPEGFGLSDWRDFLKLALDFFVRAGGGLAVDERIRHWLGTRFPRTWLVERDRPEVGRGQRRWPRAGRAGERATLVRLLAHALGTDIDTPKGEDQVDRLLAAAWAALTGPNGVLRVEADGRVLPLEALAFAPISRAWVCPVTRRFLDTTLRGITPYLPRQATDANAKCRLVELPLYDEPFGGDLEPMAKIERARVWPRGQAGIEPLRAEGLWQARGRSRPRRLRRGRSRRSAMLGAVGSAGRAGPPGSWRRRASAATAGLRSASTRTWQRATSRPSSSPPASRWTFTLTPTTTSAPSSSSQWNRPGSAVAAPGCPCLTRTEGASGSVPAATSSTNPTASPARATRSAWSAGGQPPWARGITRSRRSSASPIASSGATATRAGNPAPEATSHGPSSPASPWAMRPSLTCWRCSSEAWTGPGWTTGSRP